MSSFRKIFDSNTFAIPGYPGYYYRPKDGAVISNKGYNKHTTGNALKVYTTHDGQKYVNVMDYENCRRKLTFDRIEELLMDEIRRSNEVYDNISHKMVDLNRTIAVKQQIENYIRIKEQNSFKGAYFAPVNRRVSIDEDGNIILPPAIVFFN